MKVAAWAVPGLHYIHRDLKSQNVFLTKTGEVQIGDFGFSKLLSDSAELATSGVGIPFYLAPEICSGKPYDFRADIWFRLRPL